MRYRDEMKNAIVTAEQVKYQHYLLKANLARAIAVCGSLTDPRVVEASEALNRVVVELQKMGVVLYA